MSTLKGAAIDRFLYLLNRRIPFPVALREARNPESTLLFPEDDLLEYLHSHPDPWVYNTVKANSTVFAADFRKAFSYYLGWGKTIEWAADAALRRADSMAATRYSQPPIRRPQATKLGKIRLAFANTNGAPVTLEEFSAVAASIRKKIERNKDIYNEELDIVPHIVDMNHMNMLGYIRIKCVDKATVQWLANLLSLAPVSKSESVLLMLEWKFHRSCIYSANLENSVDDDAVTIIENLKKHNPDVKMFKWKIISRHLLEDQKTVYIHALIPRYNVKILQLKNNELKYKKSKVKFTMRTVDESIRKPEKVGLQGVFPEYEGNFLEIIESENDIDTFKWKVAKHGQLTENGVTYVWLRFKVDGLSGDVIKHSNNEISFMSQKITLYKKLNKTWIAKFKNEIKQ